MLNNLLEPLLMSLWSGGEEPHGQGGHRGPWRRAVVHPVPLLLPLAHRQGLPAPRGRHRHRDPGLGQGVQVGGWGIRVDNPQLWYLQQVRPVHQERHCTRYREAEALLPISHWQVSSWCRGLLKTDDINIFNSEHLDLNCLMPLLHKPKTVMDRDRSVKWEIFQNKYIYPPPRQMPHPPSSLQIKLYVL